MRMVLQKEEENVIGFMGNYLIERIQIGVTRLAQMM